jgi:hypothetical protein
MGHRNDETLTIAHRHVRRKRRLEPMSASEDHQGVLARHRVRKRCARPAPSSRDLNRAFWTTPAHLFPKPHNIHCRQTIYIDIESPRDETSVTLALGR